MIPGLSVIIITRNEEHDIEDCLKSVSGISSDIVLVDSGSTDRTIEIAKRYTQKIFHKEWEGFGIQKQFALAKTMGPWVLNIDADERVTPGLAEEITALLNSGAVVEKNGFLIPFRHYFLGRRLRFGGVQGETHLRLFKKETARYGDRKIHEGISVNGPIGQCRQFIDHFSYRDLGEYFRKCQEYTSLIAQQKYEKGERFHAWQYFRFPWEFIMRYVIKLGFLDGAAGFTYARLSAGYAWLKFRKLKELENLNNRRPL